METKINNLEDRQLETALHALDMKIEELKEEIKALEAEDHAQVAIEEALRAIAELEKKRDALKSKVSSSNALDQLETLAKAVGAQPMRTKQISSELYEERVDQLQKQFGVDRRKAYALAAEDDLAKRLYNLINEATEAAAYNQSVMLRST